MGRQQKQEEKWVNSEILKENPFTLRKAPEHLGVSKSRLHRLIVKGKVSRLTGLVVRLECAYNAANYLVTSEAAFRRFEAALNVKPPPQGRMRISQPPL